MHAYPDERNAGSDNFEADLTSSPPIVTGNEHCSHLFLSMLVFSISSSVCLIVLSKTSNRLFSKQGAVRRMYVN